jgi:succinate-semialdehyde dehydrogenase/glutarate-semialdehyde dehydrogenase
MPIESINPATHKLLRTFPTMNEEVIRTKIGLASEAFKSYQEVPIEHRALWMRRLASIMESELEELAVLITTEMGKPIGSSRMEIEKCAFCCRYFAENAASILSEESIPTEAANSYVRWDPLGVVLAVMPWNFPFWQVFRFLAPALMAGNVSILKHASNVPQCALAIEALVRRAGFPRGVLQVLLIDSRQVESVLADERIAAVTVTGSETAGRAVGAQAGWLIKKSLLELGGSDPFIVMPSADLGQAVATGVIARCINNGQSCIAAKRFIVHEDIYAEFESRFVAGMEAMQIGDPMVESTDIGPMATYALMTELEKQVQAAVAAGGRVLTGGEKMLGQGFFFEPTVIAGLPRTAPVYRDEIFGPVALLFKARDISEAIEIANDTPFGLAASAWTADRDEQNRFVSELQCGGVFLNTMVTSDPRLPFGGIKKSGYGRELSAAGMREFLNAKTVVMAEIFERQEEPYYEPVAMPAPLPVSQPVYAEEPVMAVAAVAPEPVEVAEKEPVAAAAEEEPEFAQDDFTRALDEALKAEERRPRNKLSIL